MEKQIKQYVIISPCYRANGHNGQYISYAETDSTGAFTLIEGDHFFDTPESKQQIRTIQGEKQTIQEVKGCDFSDDFRPIRVVEVSFDATAIKERNAKKMGVRAKQEQWYKARPTKLKDIEKYKIENPYPKADYIAYHDMCELLLSQTHTGTSTTSATVH